MTQDCDAAYDEQHGQHETPSEFAGRFGRKKLTEDEAKLCEGITDPSAAFAAVYPDYIGRHEFREKWFAKCEPAAVKPPKKKAPPAVEPEA